tara:strand:+ start:4708 stop:6066 length:1359 start_codon:yes stop_codon:yes gene_type:complete
MKNNDNDEYYKVVCEDVNLVLLIKQLKLEEERKQYLSIKRSVRKMKGSVTVDSFKEMLIKLLLYNSEELLANLPSEKDEKREREEIINSIYLAILEVYPNFDLRFICSGLNGVALAENVKDSIFDMFGPAILGADKEESKDPVSINNLSDVNKLKKYLDSNIIGQPQAVEALVDSIKLITSGLYDSASFFFVGPTGVGKTEIAKLLGEKYSGNFWKLNCAEYANAHEYAKLIGSPPGYVGHSDTCLMAEKAEQSNKWVILFDEIEKGHPKFYDFLLSLLDDGTCTDNMGRVLDFTESIFIFTSNQGVSNIKTGKRIGFGSETVSVSGSEAEIKESVKSKFPAEFMNRIDNYIFFNQLSREDIRKISSIALRNLPIKKHKCLLDYIVENGYSEEYGARNLNRFIKNKVAIKIAQNLLEGRLPKKQGDLYTPRVKDNELFLISTEENTLDQPAV